MCKKVVHSSGRSRKAPQREHQNAPLARWAPQGLAKYEIALQNSTEFSKDLKYASKIHKIPDMFWKFQKFSKVLHLKKNTKVFSKV